MSLDNFDKNKGGVLFKACMRSTDQDMKNILQKMYREDNIEQIREREKAYRDSHKDEIKERRKAYNEANKEQMKERQKTHNKSYNERS